MSNETLWQWSVHAWPAAKGRVMCLLPPVWPPPREWYRDYPNEYGDEAELKEIAPRNKPLPQKNALQTKIGELLSQPYLETVVDALRSDTHAWHIAEDESEATVKKVARWVAEHMIIHLYNLHEAALKEKSEGSLDETFLQTLSVESRTLRNRFLDAVASEFPDIGATPRSTLEKRPVSNPNGSVDLWAALACWNVHRFRLIDSFAAAEAESAADAALPPKTVIKIEELDSNEILEALLLKAIRAREHACFGIALALEEALKKMPVMRLPSEKRFAAKTIHYGDMLQGKDATTIGDVLTAARVCINNILAVRAVILKNGDAARIPTLNHMIMGQEILASIRSFSFICALSPLREFDPEGKVFAAVRRFEEASILEYDSLSKLYNGQSAWEIAIMKDKSPEEAVGKSLTTVGLCLKGASPELDERMIFSRLTEKQRLRVEARIGDYGPLSQPSMWYNALCKVLNTISPTKEAKAHEDIARMLIRPGALLVLTEAFRGLPGAEGLLPAVLQRETEGIADSLDDVVRFLVRKDEERLEAALQPTVKKTEKSAADEMTDAFLDMFSWKIPTLRDATARAAAMGWEV